VNSGCGEIKVSRATINWKQYNKMQIAALHIKRQINCVSQRIATLNSKAKGKGDGLHKFYEAARELLTPEQFDQLCTAAGFTKTAAI
jgi:hypothetical protein